LDIEEGNMKMSNEINLDDNTIDIEFRGLHKPQTGEKIPFAVQIVEVGSAKMEIWRDYDDVEKVYMYAGKNLPDINEPPSCDISFSVSFPTGMDNSDFDKVNVWFKDDVPEQMVSDLMELYTMHHFPHLENQDLDASIFADGEFIEEVTFQERVTPN
jgi:hypothetical protein